MTMYICQFKKERAIKNTVYLTTRKINSHKIRTYQENSMHKKVESINLKEL